MQLSAESFDDLNTALESHRSQGFDVFGRHSCTNSRHIRIAPVLAGKSSKSLDASIQDFTPHGMRITLPQTLRTGEKFVAEFPSESKQVVNLLCTVCRVEKSSDGHWSHVCEFICTIAASHASDAAEIHRISASMFDW